MFMRKTGKWTKRLLLSSAVVAALLNLFPPGPLLVYSLFVAAYLFEVRLRLLPRVAYGLRFLLLMLAAGWLLELLSWLTEYTANNPEPALLHPQLIPDLIIAIGFYGGWGVAWLVILRLFRFHIWEIFAVQGVYGIFVEQSGAILWTGLASLPWGVLLWLYLLLVYGATAALPPLLLPDTASARRDHLLKYPAALLILLLATVVAAVVWEVVTISLLDIIPEPGPIRERPFW